LRQPLQYLIEATPLATQKRRSLDGF